MYPFITNELLHAYYRDITCKLITMYPAPHNSTYLACQVAGHQHPDHRTRAGVGAVQGV